MVKQPRSISSKTPDFFQYTCSLILGTKRLGCPEFGKEKKPPPDGVSEYKNGIWHSFPGQVRALFPIYICAHPELVTYSGWTMPEPEGCVVGSPCDIAYWF